MFSIRPAVVAALLALLGFSGAETKAQQIDGSAYTDISAYLVDGGDSGDAASRGSHSQQPIGSGYNSASVSQTGRGNETSLIQLGYANTTSQIQVGRNNVSALTLTGNSNTVSTMQIGNSNSSSLNIAGSNNTISQTQIGNNLSYSLSTTKSGQSFSVLQTGNK